MQCKLVHYAVSDTGNAFGAARAVCKCETHNWMLDYPHYSDADYTLCPIGRIEEARDRAIAEIEEANK